MGRGGQSLFATPRALWGEYLTPGTFGPAERLGGAASGGRLSSHGKAGGRKGGQGREPGLPFPPLWCLVKRLLVFSSWDLLCVGLVGLHSPSWHWQLARAGGSRRQQTARATCLITVGSEWPCPVAFVLMESKCQRDVNTGGGELGKSPTGYSWRHSPALSWSW